MKKGMALEGYILEDGTTRPMKQYDDTELRAKIQANTDKIDNLQSQTNSIDGRVTYLETHGGAEDPTKADKVVEAVEGNLAGLDDEGNLTDSGYAPSDFAPATGSTEYAPASGSTNYAAASHSHNRIGHGGASIELTTANGGDVIEIAIEDSLGNIESTTIKQSNIENLDRALSAPATPYCSEEFVLKKANSESSQYLISGYSDVVTPLNNFISHYSAGVVYSCTIHIKYTGASLGSVIGFATWNWAGEGDNGIYVILYIGSNQYLLNGSGSSVSSIVWESTGTKDSFQTF